MGANWTTTLLAAKGFAASSPLAAAAAATGAAAGASAPAPAQAALAGQLIGTVTRVSGGHPSVPSAGQAPAAASKAYTASDGQASTAGPAPAIAPDEAAPAPVQSGAEQQPQAILNSAGISKDISTTQDRVYSAALAATAYVSDRAGSAHPPSAPKRASIPGVSTFGQMLGGRRRFAR